MQTRSRILARWLAATTACALALAIPCVALAGGNTTSVSTEVYGTDGLPIGGAVVDVAVLKSGTYRPLTELVADTSGTADLTAKAGSYRLDVTAPSADPETTYLTAVRGQAYVLEFTLDSYGALAGTVRNGAGGAPIAGAQVDLYRRNDDGTWPTAPSASVVASDGTYAIDPLPAGTYHVYASAVGYATGFHDTVGLGTPTDVAVNRDSSVTGIDVSLTAVAESGWIRGHVYTGALMSPVNAAYVMLYRQNADGTWPATSPGWGTTFRTVYSDALGAWDSGEIPLGTYRVRFFTTMTGSQWWQYAATVETATAVPVSAPGETVTGIDGWFKKP